MKEMRSDLAVELCKELSGNDRKETGIEWKKERLGPLTSETVLITDPKGAKLCGKPEGSYCTVRIGKLWLDHGKQIREKLFAFRELLRRYLSGDKDHGSVLVAGLGNENITADAIGPIAVENLIVTRHIRAESPQLFRELGLCELCAMAPGVLGQTGIESAEVIRSVLEKIRPDLLIVIDALAARDPEHLVTTLQISDSGISPGSGVGNRRPSLSPMDLGIPVIAIGVPTVVDAATLAADAVRRFSHSPTDRDEIAEEWGKNGLNYFVTPKETDQIIRILGKFLAHGINLALNPELSYEDMLSLSGGT